MAKRSGETDRRPRRRPPAGNPEMRNLFRSTSAGASETVGAEPNHPFSRTQNTLGFFLALIDDREKPIDLFLNAGAIGADLLAVFTRAEPGAGNESRETARILIGAAAIDALA